MKTNTTEANSLSRQDKQYKLYNNTIVNTIAVKQSEHTHCMSEQYCNEAQVISLHCNQGCFFHKDIASVKR